MFVYVRNAACSSNLTSFTLRRVFDVPAPLRMRTTPAAAAAATSTITTTPTTVARAISISLRGVTLHSSATYLKCLLHQRSGDYRSDDWGVNTYGAGWQSELGGTGSTAVTQTVIAKMSHAVAPVEAGSQLSQHKATVSPSFITDRVYPTRRPSWLPTNLASDVSSCPVATATVLHRGYQLAVDLRGVTQCFQY